MGVMCDIEALFVRFDGSKGLLGCYCMEEYWFQRNRDIAAFSWKLEKTLEVVAE